MMTEEKKLELVSNTNFDGENLYKDGNQPCDSEIKKRIENYYKPYHLN